MLGIVSKERLLKVFPDLIKEDYWQSFAENGVNMDLTIEGIEVGQKILCMLPYISITQLKEIMNDYMNNMKYTAGIPSEFKHYIFEDLNKVDPQIVRNLKDSLYTERELIPPIPERKFKEAIMSCHPWEFYNRQEVAFHLKKDIEKIEERITDKRDLIVDAINKEKDRLASYILGPLLNDYIKMHIEKRCELDEQEYLNKKLTIYKNTMEQYLMLIERPVTKCVTERLLEFKPNARLVVLGQLEINDFCNIEMTDSQIRVMSDSIYNVFNTNLFCDNPPLIDSHGRPKRDFYIFVEAVRSVGNLIDNVELFQTKTLNPYSMNDRGYYLYSILLALSKAPMRLLEKLSFNTDQVDEANHLLDGAYFMFNESKSKLKDVEPIKVIKEDNDFNPFAPSDSFLSAE